MRTFILMGLLGLLSTPFGEGLTYANGIRIGLNAKDDFYTPLVPVRHNFKSCFKEDPQGNLVLGICSAEPQPKLFRGPAMTAKELEESNKKKKTPRKTKPKKTSPRKRNVSNKSK